MTTLWKWRIFLFVRRVDATTANKTALASIYVNHGSGETLENELRMFDSVVKFSTTGALPAQVYGINLTAQTAMKDEFVAFVRTLTDARWAVVANTTLPQYADGELVATNFPVTPNGQIVDWETAKQYLFNHYGLREIPPAEV